MAHDFVVYLRIPCETLPMLSWFLNVPSLTVAFLLCLPCATLAVQLQPSAVPPEQDPGLTLVRLRCVCSLASSCNPRICYHCTCRNTHTSETIIETIVETIRETIGVTIVETRVWWCVVVWWW